MNIVSLLLIATPFVLQVSGDPETFDITNIVASDSRFNTIGATDRRYKDLTAVDTRTVDVTARRPGS